MYKNELNILNGGDEEWAIIKKIKVTLNKD
jgi:hypothetical protein